MKAALVFAYLGSVALANLSVWHWGPRAAIYNGFLLIGLDLVARDRLHDYWRTHLRRNMAALIITGSALFYVLSLALTDDSPFASAERIALASCVAFAAASATDTVAYHLLRGREWFERANWSNLASAAVDSAVFLPLAFGGFPWQAIFALFCAKVAGGVVWSFVLKGRASKNWPEPDGYRMAEGGRIVSTSR